MARAFKEDMAIRKRGVALVVIAVLVVVGGGLSGLAALRHRGGGSSSSGAAASDEITDDTHFYGQSEPVYPAPEAKGTGEWAAAYEKAAAMVRNMTFAEKISLTAGVRAETSCSGNVPAVKRLGFPGMCMSDAGQGLRMTDFVSSFPSGIHVGSSWNRGLARRRAREMGAEFKRKGVNVLLGPVVGPLGRTVLGGRNWEGFSVDPYLSGQFAFETVTGVQAVGVMTSTKHYIGNEQETNRMPSGQTQAVSANIDDKTMHEVYLWPFQDAVRAGTANIMCSYQRVNNSYGCANSKTLNGLLKTELGFQGFVVTDWNALYTGSAAALAGLDMAMPGDEGLWGDKLAEAVKNGTVPESRLTDMATRIIAAWYRLGQDADFPDPGVGMPPDLSKPHQIVDGRNASSKPVLLDGAIEGHVLVKNVNKTLPLKSPRMVSIFGYSAKSPDQNNCVGPGALAWMNGLGFTSGATPQDAGISTAGTIYSGGGSGATSQSLLSSPYDALVSQFFEDGTEAFWDLTSAEPAVNPASDVCLVLANSYASEGYDRPAARDDYTDGLVRRVADQCNNTVVVVHNAGARLVDRFVDHPNVTALMFAHLPGQHSGRALASLLYGRANPSGKLPYTVARNESDYGGGGGGGVYAPARGEGRFRWFPQADFSEGALVDYRHFDARGIEPRYEFGFGLSYTTFAYSDLRITSLLSSTNSSASNNSTNSTNSTGEYPVGPVREGGPADLWDVVARVTANVTNTGDVGGAEAAQLYVSMPPGGGGGDGDGDRDDDVPVRQLRGFDKPFIGAGRSATVSFALTRRDLSAWEVAAQRWRLRRRGASYGVYVGPSSRRLPLRGELVL
ncbi:uncharacterized protein E0L32_012118 [Thyridium curvatum]|uniref:beta-glucosidase n=1 Tax=Thyridium curvatum TaxID=1093900 RepID=A0A507BFP2_9PEZI|nr:uncharacterized protein E0L32_012118 [Thyridium curvatum]TPX17584.1 hypothetical protein E0L32_012118 [Thyridium curvatum]